MVLRGNGRCFGSCPSTTRTGGVHVPPQSSENAQTVYASGESPPPIQLTQRRPFGVSAAPLFIAQRSVAAAYFGPGVVLIGGGTSARSATASIARTSSARTLASVHSSARTKTTAGRQATTAVIRVANLYFLKFTFRNPSSLLSHRRDRFLSFYVSNGIITAPPPSTGYLPLFA